MMKSRHILLVSALVAGAFLCWMGFAKSDHDPALFLTDAGSYAPNVAYVDGNPTFDPNAKPIDHLPFVQTGDKHLVPLLTAANEQLSTLQQSYITRAHRDLTLRVTYPTEGNASVYPIPQNGITVLLVEGAYLDANNQPQTIRDRIEINCSRVRQGDPATVSVDPA